MGGPGSGRPKEPRQLVKDAVQGINVATIFKQLKEWAKGKPVYCPYCNKDTGIYTADTVALQSAIELLNRKLGKPVQQVNVDITETIQLTADQIDLVISNHPVLKFLYQQYQLLITQGKLPGEVIEGEYKEVKEGLTNGSNKGTEKGIPERIHEEEKV